MQKYVLVLALQFLLFVCQFGEAAQNPFTDVPKGHWVYESLQQLQKDGIINVQGEHNGLLTRYECAILVAKALANAADVTKGAQEAIDKLSVEFANELKVLNVKVADLEERIKLQPQFSADVTWQAGLLKERNPQWTGDFAAAALSGEQYDGNWGSFSGVNQGTDGDSSYNYMRLRLLLNGTVNDHWSYSARLVTYSDFISGSANATPNVNGAFGKANIDNVNNVVMFDYGYLKGDYGTWQIYLGKIDTTLPYAAAQSKDEGGFGVNQATGLISDSYMAGVRLALIPDEKWRINVYYGSEETLPAFDAATGIFTSSAMASPYANAMSYADGNDWTEASQTLRSRNNADMMGVDVGYAYSDSMNVYASWSQVRANSAGWGNIGQWDSGSIYNAQPEYAGTVNGNQLWAQRSIRYWQAGLDYMFTDRLLFSGFFGGSSARINNRAWVARMDYSPCDGAVVDTTQAGAYSLYVYYQYLERYSAWMPTYDVVSINGLGSKGWTLGGYYVFCPNASINLEYAWYMSANNSSVPGAFADVPGNYGIVGKWYAGIDYYF